MNELTLFLSAFVTVFALGFQQMNVHGRHFVAAALTSLVIGGAQIFMWRLVPDASPTEIAATLAGGPVGIVASMYFHPRIMRFIKRLS